jgi:hypothetical protein
MNSGNQNLKKRRRQITPKIFPVATFLTVGQVRETNKCFYLSPITGNIGKCIKMVLLFTTNTKNCKQNNNESYDNVTLCLLVVIILN